MSNDCAIVTGCEQPFEALLAKALAERGMAVVAATAPGATLALGTAAQPAGLEHHSFDLTRVAGAQALMAASQTLGPLKLLVNGAGRGAPTPITQHWQTAVDAAANIFDRNLLHMLLTSRAAVPLLVASTSSAILNLTSLDVMPAANKPTNGPDTDLLSASRWALNGFTDAWSKSLRDAGVRVNGLCLPEPLDNDDIEPALALALALLEDSRTGENVAFDPAQPGELAPPRPPHRRITG